MNIESFIEKLLKIKSALKILEIMMISKALKMTCILLLSSGFNTVVRDLNQYQIVLLLFAKVQHIPKIKAQCFYGNFLMQISSLSV